MSKLRYLVMSVIFAPILACDTLPCDGEPAPGTWSVTREGGQYVVEGEIAGVPVRVVLGVAPSTGALAVLDAGKAAPERIPAVRSFGSHAGRGGLVVEIDRAPVLLAEGQRMSGTVIALEQRGPEVKRVWTTAWIEPGEN